jgi:hypothetical protein
MCGGGGGGGADQAREQEAARQKRIAEGMGYIETAFKPFDDSYFNKKTEAYTGYYLPQLQQQYNDALSALKLQLSAAGLGASSAGAFGSSRLAEDYAKKQAEVLGNAADYSNQARGDVQAMRSQLVSQLNATGDATAAANAANNQASIAMQRPDTFAPLAQAFNDYARLYARDKSYADNSGGAYSGVFNQYPSKKQQSSFALVNS